MLKMFYDSMPVDGVEISCSPRVWKVADVEQDLKNALEQNMGSIRTQPSVSQKERIISLKI